MRFALAYRELFLAYCVQIELEAICELWRLLFAKRSVVLSPFIYSHSRKPVFVISCYCSRWQLSTNFVALSTDKQRQQSTTFSCLLCTHIYSYTTPQYPSCIFPSQIDPQSPTSPKPQTPKPKHIPIPKSKPKPKHHHHHPQKNNGLRPLQIRPTNPPNHPPPPPPPPPTPNTSPSPPAPSPPCPDPDPATHPPTPKERPFMPRTVCRRDR